MIALPKGTSVTIAGRTWTDEIPAELCPEHLKPCATPVDEPAAKPTKSRG